MGIVAGYSGSMVKVYGREIMFLIGGALHKGDASVTGNWQKLKKRVA